VIMQKRRLRLDRLVDVDDRWQDLILDFDQLQGIGSNLR
jgi:hypothetical protein